MYLAISNEKKILYDKNKILIQHDIQNRATQKFMKMMVYLDQPPEKAENG